MVNSNLVAHQKTEFHFSKAAWASFSIIVLAYSMNYGINLILARWLRAEVFGDYSTVVSTLQLFSMLVLFGADIAMLKFLPEYFALNDWKSAVGYLRYTGNLLAKIALITFILGVVVAVALYFLDEFNILHFSDHHPVFLFLWIIPIFALAIFFGKLLRSLHFIYLSQLSFSLMQPIAMFLGLGLAIWFHSHFDIHGAMFMYVATLILVIACQILIMHYFFPKQLLTVKPRYNSEIWLPTAIQLLVVNFFTSNLNSFCIIISEIFDTNEKHTGIVSAILLICNFMWLSYSTIVFLVSPYISLAVMQKDKKQLQTLFNSSTLFILGLTSVLFLIIIVGGHFFLSHFGASFVQGYIPLVIAALGIWLSSSMGSAQLFLQYSGKQKQLLPIILTALVLYLIIGSLLAKNFGLMGSALSILLLSIFLTVSYLVKLNQILHIKPFYYPSCKNQ